MVVAEWVAKREQANHGSKGSVGVIDVAGPMKVAPLSCLHGPVG